MLKPKIRENWRGFARSATFPAHRIARRRLSTGTAPRRRVPSRSSSSAPSRPEPSREEPLFRTIFVSHRRLARRRGEWRRLERHDGRRRRVVFGPRASRGVHHRAVFPRRGPRAGPSSPAESAPARRHHETGSPGTAAAATTLPIFSTPPASARARGTRADPRGDARLRASRRKIQTRRFSPRRRRRDSSRGDPTRPVRARARARPRARASKKKVRPSSAPTMMSPASRATSTAVTTDVSAPTTAPAVPAPTSARRSVQSSAPYTTDASPSRATHVTKSLCHGASASARRDSDETMTAPAPAPPPPSPTRYASRRSERPATTAQSPARETAAHVAQSRAVTAIGAAGKASMAVGGRQM